MRDEILRTEALRQGQEQPRQPEEAQDIASLIEIQ